MKTLSLLIVAFFFCTMFVCCAPNNLQHLHSKKPRATMIHLRGPVSPAWGTSLYNAFKDKKCSMIVAWIESGGGSVTEVKLLEHRIRTMRNEYPKSFMVYSERILASGAYWLACLADSIVLSPAAYCGSIGVTYTRIDSTKLDAARGVVYHIFRSGQLKGLGNPHLPITAHEIHLASLRISRIYREFIGVLMEKRGKRLASAYDSLQTMVDYPMSFDDFIMTITDGDVFAGDDACAYGLADKVLWFDQLLGFLKSNGYKVSTVRGMPVTKGAYMKACDSLMHHEIPVELIR